MKKYYLPLFLIVATLAGCTSSDVETDVDDLKTRVEALEKSKSVIGITFNGTQMVLTYSTSETQTLDMPSGLNGNNGADGTNGTNGTNGSNGADGTGIASISYNETTCVLTIVLTNGNESQFRIVTNSEQQLAAVLISDINGAMYVTDVTMGAIPLATITYDANFNITSMLSQTVVDGKIMNNFDITKQYSNNVLTNVQTRTFATQKEVAYDREYYNETIVKESVIIESNFSGLGNNDLDFVETNQDGTSLTYYKFEGCEGWSWKWDSEKQKYIHTYTNIRYNKYPNALKKTYTSYPENNRWQYIEVVDANTAYEYNYFKDNSSTIDNVTTYEFWYYKAAKYTKTGFFNIGDIRTTQNNQIENNAAGHPEKIYETANGASTPNRYVQLTYNTAGYVIRADEYNKTSDTWVKNSIYLTFEYNTSNLVASVKRNYSDGKTEEVYKNVYDKNGNPVEIYAWGGEIRSYYDYFDPIGNPTDPWVNNYNVTVPEGLQLVSKVEYDYSCKNFLGNSIGAIMPELQNYKIFNAPIKISSTQSANYLWVEYGGYNDSGYPEMLTVNTYNSGTTYRLQFDVKYVKK